MKNKKKKGICPSCGNKFEDYISNNRKFCSKKCVGKANGKRMIGKSFVKGKHWKVKDTSKYHKKLSEDTKRKIGLTRIREKHWNWKGGTSRAYKDGYYSVEYKKWRLSVFIRDSFTCQNCGQVGRNLSAHHIKSFRFYPELRFVLNN